MGYCIINIWVYTFLSKNKEQHVGLIHNIRMLSLIRKAEFRLFSSFYTKINYQVLIATLKADTLIEI